MYEVKYSRIVKRLNKYKLFPSINPHSFLLIDFNFDYSND